MMDQIGPYALAFVGCLVTIVGTLAVRILNKIEEELKALSTSLQTVRDQAFASKEAIRDRIDRIEERIHARSEDVDRRIATIEGQRSVEQDHGGRRSAGIVGRRQEEIDGIIYYSADTTP